MVIHKIKPNPSTTEEMLRLALNCRVFYTLGTVAGYLSSI